MALTMVLLLSTAFLVLAPGFFLQGEATTSYAITMTVYDTVNKTPNQTYSTEVVFRGVLIGAMRRAQENSSYCFRFTTSENLDYGPYLESVNGLKTDRAKQLYWVFNVELKNGTIISPDVGIGCYIPNPEDHIIFKFIKMGLYHFSGQYCHNSDYSGPRCPSSV